MKIPCQINDVIYYCRDQNLYLLYHKTTLRMRLLHVLSSSVDAIIIFCSSCYDFRIIPLLLLLIFLLFLFVVFAVTVAVAVVVVLFLLLF